MQFTDEMLTPAQEDISDIRVISHSRGKNIQARVSYDGADLIYIYALDPRQSGKEFIYAPDSGLIAEVPLYQGKPHGKGKVLRQDGLLETQYFYYGKVFPKFCNDNIVATDGDAYVIQLSAAFAGYDKKDLIQNNLPTYILNAKEKQNMMTVIFEPVAQNTIVRPMAQAISLARGGEMVKYVDTADKKEKAVDMSDLSWMTLRTKIHGLETPVPANSIALKARHEAIRVRVLVNDVVVNVTAETTLDQAMAQFRKKLARQERMTEAMMTTRQRTA